MKSILKDKKASKWLLLVYYSSVNLYRHSDFLTESLGLWSHIQLSNVPRSEETVYVLSVCVCVCIESKLGVHFESAAQSSSLGAVRWTLPEEDVTQHSSAPTKSSFTSSPKVLQDTHHLYLQTKTRLDRYFARPKIDSRPGDITFILSNRMGWSTKGDYNPRFLFPPRIWMTCADCRTVWGSLASGESRWSRCARWALNTEILLSGIWWGYRNRVLLCLVAEMWLL